MLQFYYSHRTNTIVQFYYYMATMYERMGLYLLGVDVQLEERDVELCLLRKRYYGRSNMEHKGKIKSRYDALVYAGA